MSKLDAIVVGILVLGVLVYVIVDVLRGLITAALRAVRGYMKEMEEHNRDAWSPGDNDEKEG